MATSTWRTAVLRWAPAGLFLSAAFALAACNTPPPEDFPEITYKDRPAIRFDVREVVVERGYVPPLDRPNVDHLMPDPPVLLALRWAQDRLVAAGEAGRLVYRVVDASVVEIPLEGETGFQDLITVSQSERYDARLAVVVELVDEGGEIRSIVKTEAERSVTVSEDASLYEREEVWFKLGEAVMNDLDSELEVSLYRHMSAYIVN